MKTKCFNLYQFRKEAGVKDLPGLGYTPAPVEPYDWSTLTENTPESRKRYVEKQIADILHTSQAPLADSYGAFQKRPFQDGYGSKEHMLPIHNLYRRLQAYDDTLPAE